MFLCLVRTYEAAISFAFSISKLTIVGIGVDDVTGVAAAGTTGVATVILVVALGAAVSSGKFSFIFGLGNTNFLGSRCRLAPLFSKVHTVSRLYRSFTGAPAGFPISFFLLLADSKTTKAATDKCIRTAL
jgi:hypothetical protein